jgi:cobalamin synthase
MAGSGEGEAAALSGGERALAFFVLSGKMVSLYLLGLCMSLATLLPTILRYLSSTRLSQASETKNLLVYEDRRRYAAWFLNLISPYRSSGNGTDLNFAVIVLPAAAVLFMYRYRSMAMKRFGGISGDLAGWFLVNSELVMLAVGVFLLMLRFTAV